MLDEAGNHVLDAAGDDIVGNRVDGSVGVGVDADDDGTLVHASDMLNLARDTAGDVQLGTYGDTGLTDLAVMVGETGIDSCTAGTYLSVKFLGQLEEHVEVLA